MIASGVTLTSAAARSPLSCSRSAIRALASTVRNSVTCGIENFDATMAAAICLRVPRTGTRCSVRSRAGRSAGSGSASGSSPGTGAAAAVARGQAAAARLLALARTDQGGLPVVLRVPRGAVAGGLRHAPAGVDLQQRRADVDGIALTGMQLEDRASERGGDLDHRLGRLDLDDRLVQGDGVALVDQPAHHLGFGQSLAEIRELEVTLWQLGSPSLALVRSVVEGPLHRPQDAVDARQVDVLEPGRRVGDVQAGAA